MAAAAADRLEESPAMPRKIRCFAAALVLALLTSGAAQARSPHIRPGSSGFFAPLPGTDAGSDMDPNGRS
jgi:hypothetical protein